MVSRPGSLAVLASLALFLVVPAVRADDDPKQLIAVAAQKLEAEYKDALVKAFDVGKKDPAKAIEILSDMVKRVEPNKAITDKRRKDMLDALNDRIQDLQVAQKRREAGDAADADKEAVKRSREEVQKKEEERQRDFQETIDRIKKLRAEGKTAEANQLAGELSERRGRTAETIVVSATTSVQGQIEEYKRLQTEKSRRTGDALRDVERSMLPPKGDIEFPDPKKWKELTTRRKNLLNPLTEKEKGLIKALNTPITVSFKDRPLQEVLEALEAKTGQTISVDKATLEAVGLTMELPVSISIKGVTARFMLKSMLGHLGLTFVIDEGTIAVLTPQEAKNKMVVRAYYVGDLAPMGDLRFGPVYNQQVLIQTMGNLVQMIQSIDPSSWDANNGPGSVAVEWKTMSLVIKNSAEMHYMLGGHLR